MNDIETTAAIILAGLLGRNDCSPNIVRISVQTAKDLRKEIDQDDELHHAEVVRRDREDTPGVLEQENHDLRKKLEEIQYVTISSRMPHSKVDRIREILKR